MPWIQENTPGCRDHRRTHLDALTPGEHTLMLQSQENTPNARTVAAFVSKRHVPVLGRENFGHTTYYNPHTN